MGKEELIFNWSQLYKMKRVTELDAGNVCTTLRVYLIPLNCTVKKVNMLNFSVYFSTKIKKDGEKKDEISPPVAGFLLVSLWHDYHDARRTLNLPVQQLWSTDCGPFLTHVPQ